MKNIIILVYFIAIIGMQYSFCQSIKKMPGPALVGTWTYKSGHYIYFDSSNRKLLQRNVTEIQQLKVNVTPTAMNIIYPNRTFNTSYELSAEKGRKFISVNMGKGLVKYQISYLNNKFLTLKSRHSINFYVDGDPKKKAAYTIFVLNMVKTWQGSNKVNTSR